MDKLRSKFNRKGQLQYDYLAKIVIIGNSAVGKTNILLRFVDKNYSMVHTPTIGVDFRSKVVEIPLKKQNTNKKLKLQLWDTAGQQRFRTLTDTYFKGASGIIIVYSINDRRSFEDVRNWIYQLQQNGAEKLPRVIVGNKCDLKDERKVTFEEGRMLADEFKCTFMQVSAKENINIEQMFTQLSMNIVSDIKTQLQTRSSNNQPLQPNKINTVLINQPKSVKSECCN